MSFSVRLAMMRSNLKTGLAGGLRVCSLPGGGGEGSGLFGLAGDFGESGVDNDGEGLRAWRPGFVQG